MSDPVVRWLERATAVFVIALAVTVIATLVR